MISLASICVRLYTLPKKVITELKSKEVKPKGKISLRLTMQI